MNVELAGEWLRRMLEGQKGLREIDPALPVPWTPAQWIVLFVLLAGFAAVLVWFYRWITRWLARRQTTFVSLLGELDRIDDARLQRKMAHEPALRAIADVLRGGLQLAERKASGTSAYRTTSQWCDWCRRRGYSGDVCNAVREVLVVADAVKFSGAEVSLDQLRRVTERTREVLDRLESGPRSGASEATVLLAQEDAA